MFAGKLHAVLARAWRTRAKGRDFYDYIFYLSRRVPVNLDHLRERLVASGTIERNEPFSISVLKDMLYGKFREIDYGEARLDVIPFISDPEKLSLWSSDFFCSITDEYLLSV